MEYPIAEKKARDEAEAARSFPTRKAFRVHLDAKHQEAARPRSAEKQRAAMAV